MDSSHTQGPITRDLNEGLTREGGNTRRATGSSTRFITYSVPEENNGQGLRARSGPTSQLLPPGEERWKIFSGSLLPARKNHTELEELRERDKSLQDFYLRQNRLIDSFQNLESDVGLTDEVEDGSQSHTALNVSFACNVVLFLAKVYISILSGSLSVIASAVDSSVDLISGVVLFFTSHAMQRRNVYMVYPVGKARMEPLGVIVFGTIMGMVSLRVIQEALFQFISPPGPTHITLPTWCVLGATIILKFSLWLYCRRFFHSPAVMAYAQDHLNDIFSNAFGLAGATLGNLFMYWLDPLAALIFSLYIIKNWAGTCYQQIRKLIGEAASPLFHQRLTYICWNHHQEIRQIDTVRAFHFGMRFFVEVDIVLRPDIPLREAHDIGESLQIKLEKLPDVERAFVHLDFETSHKPEHKLV